MLGPSRVVASVLASVLVVTPALAQPSKKNEANAQELVRRLTGHPALEEVRYPGFGAIISIVVRGGAEPAEELADRTELWVHATSLGGVEVFRRHPVDPKRNRLFSVSK